MSANSASISLTVVSNASHESQPSLLELGSFPKVDDPSHNLSRARKKGNHRHPHVSTKLASIKRRILTEVDETIC